MGETAIGAHSAMNCSSVFTRWQKKQARSALLRRMKCLSGSLSLSMWAREGTGAALDKSTAISIVHPSRRPLPCKGRAHVCGRGTCVGEEHVAISPRRHGHSDCEYPTFLISSRNSSRKGRRSNFEMADTLTRGAIGQIKAGDFNDVVTLKVHRYPSLDGTS